jgi:hypothetical protein
LIGSVIALIGLPREKGKVEEAVGFSGDRGGAGRVEQRGGRRKEGGERETDRWVPAVSAAGKRKREGGKAVGWRGGWAGPPGPQGASAGFCFFSFPFSNIIFKSFFNSNSNQTFSNFSQEFYRLFRSHTSKQKSCKPNDDAHTLVVSKFIKLSLIFLELNLNSNLISLNP